MASYKGRIDMDDYSDHHEHHHATEYKDPVCGMSTNDKETFIKYEFLGKPYFFFSENCLEKFRDNSEIEIFLDKQNEYAINRLIIGTILLAIVALPISVSRFLYTGWLPSYTL